MEGFRTGIKSKVKGYTVKEAEMRYAPDGTPITEVRLGCGGSEKVPATFINVTLWGKAAEKLSEIGSRKGLAVEADGSVMLKRWQYQNKWYTQLELRYVKAFSIQGSDTDMEIIPIDERVSKEKEKAEEKVEEK